MSSKQ